MKRILMGSLIVAVLCLVHGSEVMGAERQRQSKEPESFSSLDPRPNRGDELFPSGFIKFEDADLAQALDVYSELSKRAIIRGGNLPQAKITFRNTLSLTRQEALQALDSVLAQNGITMIPQGTKFVKAVPSAQAAQEAAPLVDWPADELPDSATYIQYIVEVKHIMPRDVAPALQPFAKMPQSILAIDASGLVILRDYSSNVRRMLHILEKMDKPPRREAPQARK